VVAWREARTIGADQPPIPVPPPNADRWPVLRRWLLGAAALFAVASAAGGILSGEPLFAIAAWIFASLPIVYLIVAAIRGKFSRAIGPVVAAALALVVAASTVIALVSCGQRLEPAADLSGCDLTDLELAGLDLSRSDLTEANLSGVNLRRTILDGSDLTQADIRDAVLEGTSLKNATLERTDLRNTDLTRAIFSPSTLEGSRLDGANLEQVDLSGVSLKNASAMGTNFSGGTFEGSDLSGVVLDGSNLDGATLIGATGLSDETLAQALGVGTDVLGSTLIEREIRLEQRPDILAALSSACGGNGVAGTAPYPQGDLHPMVILDERGDVGVDTDQAVGLGWEPMAVRFAQLVACVSEEEDIQVEHCPYTLEGGGVASITRVRYQRDIRVIEASTGRTVFDKTLEGSNPQECPLFHTFSNLNQSETFGGSSIGFSKVKNEIAGFVS
jgi:uncharacterized protein YjbI with pentapeptide repeats